MPAMAVTSLLTPGSEAAAAAAGRPQTRGGTDQTTPGSAQRSTSAGGSRSRGGARGAEGVRAWAVGPNPFFFAAPSEAFLPALHLGRADSSPQIPLGVGGSSILKLLSGIPQHPTSFEKEGALVAADL